ncbi:hypothetical protein V8J82_22480 [Gymnodinialimonas sp. 2305UL16-5]|uniref:hypothetical protein n=1 Tax=Gymnodinialimonas mytili TaxID=3126503 RepID=UPI00309B2A0A
MRKPGRAAYLSVATRVTDHECAALDRFVGRAGMRKRAAVLRRLVRFLGDYFAPTPDEEVFLASAEAHLSRLGGNFNQIAGSLSASMKKIGRADPTRQQVEIMLRAADDVAHIRTVLGQMLDNHQIKTETLRARLDAVDPLDEEYE